MYIKGFDKDLCCRGMQFEVGKEYKIDSEDLRLCTGTVFHFCDSLQKVHSSYAVTENNRFCEIEILGETISDEDKMGSNYIKIKREIVGQELDVLKGLINGNSGIFNSGNRNSGDRNSGDRNSGNGNSGYWNSGYWNSGYWNSGYWNSGDRNSGNGNSGNWNSGNRNSGYRNSGDWNSGDMNSGYWNSGNGNSGYRNSGNRNSGYFNSCDFSNGVFNTEEPEISIFNKPSGLTLREFYESKYYEAINSEPLELTQWIEYSEDEKSKDSEKERIGGYLLNVDYKDACHIWWNKLTEENKRIIMDIPNFDKEIFFEITGIEIQDI